MARVVLGFGLGVAVTASMSSVASAAVPAPFFNGFEQNTNGWMAATQVASGTNGIASATGTYHAEAAAGAFTRWGAYSDTFPAGGWTTYVDIYLNPATLPANGTRFDWTSAVTNTAGAHQRDFAFNVGGYNDSDATGSGPRFVMTASNNTGIGGANPKNPGRDPFTITAAGWYRFQHVFSDNAGTLSVRLSVLNSGGTTLHSWTLSSPADQIATTGGNRYGWFPLQQFPVLAIDNSRLSVDADQDGVVDDDNCPSTANPGQEDEDADGTGDACDPDIDGDGLANGSDNCATTPNPGQANTDGDSLGDACDPDDDNDGVPDSGDNCQLDANADQADLDGDDTGDACDADVDGDTVGNEADNCVTTPNPGQANYDGDALGDACDPDDDNDGAPDTADNCPLRANADQADRDGDGTGTACDPEELPATTGDCKKDGWRLWYAPTGRFKNQGDCVSYIATDGRNPPSARTASDGGKKTAAAKTRCKKKKNAKKCKRRSKDR